MKLLHVDSSILGAGSVSRELSALIVRRWTDGSDVTVEYLDLAAEPLPHLTLAPLPAAHPASAGAGPLDAAGEAARLTSERILESFLAADTVVIGAPMYNFTVSTQLKAWIDRLLVPGKTFRYGANGPEGLAGAKRIVVAIARGGFYGAETGYASAEHAENYLRTAFGFIGVTKLEFVVAEGLATGDHNKANAVTHAREAVTQLAA